VPCGRRGGLGGQDSRGLEELRLGQPLSHFGPDPGRDDIVSRSNALKTGLNRTALVPSEDAALYEAHLAPFRELYQPVGDQELALVQSLADTHWRIARIPSLELTVFALVKMEFAELFADLEEAVPKQLIDGKVFLAYQRQLVILGVQEVG